MYIQFIFMLFSNDIPVSWIEMEYNINLIVDILLPDTVWQLYSWIIPTVILHLLHEKNVVGIIITQQ